MFKGKEIIVVTPAGRKEYLQCLVPQVLALHQLGLVDEYQLWLNTTNSVDLEYMQHLADLHPGVIRLCSLPIGTQPNGNMTIHHFFAACTNPHAVYVRFDDDIVLLDDADAFKRILEFRIDNPRYFLVYANILNNGICSHILQRFGKLSTNAGLAGYHCTDNLGWKSPAFAEDIHKQVRACNHDLSRFRIPGTWTLYYNERVSINCILWLGSTFAQFSGCVGTDEEQWLSVDKPKADGLQNIIFLDYVVVHYAFYTQREHLVKNTNFLEAYQQVSLK